MTTKILWSLVIISIILLGLVIFFAVYDYREAKKTCAPLESEGDCHYKICMAAEYQSGEMVRKAENCVFKFLIKDTLGEVTE